MKPSGVNEVKVAKEVLKMRKKRKRKEDSSWKAIRFVRSKRYDGLPTLNSPKVAEAVGVTPQSLSRAFSRGHNMKFYDFLKKCKLTLFDEMLRNEPHIPVEDLISRFEYESDRYFRQQFKELYGMTPEERREYHEMEAIAINNRAINKAGSEKNRTSNR